jgi:hypothetical protein
MVEQTKSDATLGWDASPITTARMCAEVYAQIKDQDWSIVGTSIRLSWDPAERPCLAVADGRMLMAQERRDVVTTADAVA